MQRCPAVAALASRQCGSRREQGQAVVPVRTGITLPKWRMDLGKMECRSLILLICGDKFGFSFATSSVMEPLMITFAHITQLRRRRLRA
jgi:hypothetical protein